MGDCFLRLSPLGGQPSGQHRGRDLDDGRTWIGRKQRQILERFVGSDLVQAFQLRGGCTQPSGGCEGEAAGVVPDPSQKQKVIRRPGLLQNFLPLAEPGIGEERHNRKTVEHWQFAQLFGRQLRRDLASGVNRYFAAALHAGRVPEKMNVVRVITERIDALGPALGDVVLIGRDCLHVGLGCVCIAAQPPIDVRRHMNQMSRPGR